MITGHLLHSVSYGGLWGQAFLDVPAFVDKAAELGFDGVMLMAKRPHVSVLDYGVRQRASLRAQLRRRKLKHAVLAGYTNFTADWEHGEVPQREIQVQYVTALAELARDLGASSVRVFTGYHHPAASLTAQSNAIVGALRECAARAAGFGVQLGIQNHHDVGVGWASFQDLLGQIGHRNARAMFDAWAPALHGEDSAEAALALAPKMIHTTVADYQLRSRYRYEPTLVNYTPETAYTVAVPMGEGFIPYRAFFQALERGGFTGTVAYEMCSSLRDGGDLKTLDRYARRYLEYMRG